MVIILFGHLLNDIWFDYQYSVNYIEITGTVLLTFFIIKNILKDCRSKLSYTDAILSNIHLGIIAVDARGQIKKINNRGKEILGLDNLNSAGQHFSCVVPWRQLDLLLETLQTGRAYQDYELTVNGITLRIDTARLVTYDKEVTGAVMVFQDITERRLWEENLRQAEKLSVVGELAAGTAHEIRNPLTSIKGFVQLLQNRYHERGMQFEKEYTEIMLAEIDRINLIISEFLALSNPLQPDPRIIDLKTILDEIMLLMKGEANLKNINVKMEIMGNLPFLVVEVDQIKQALLNLVTNAFWAMKDGGTLTIKAYHNIKDKAVEITFTDTGGGMSPEVLARIFEPFYSTREQGTGLGLTVTYRIVQNHGGTLTVTSEPGKGSVFTVKLPVDNSFGYSKKKPVHGNRVGLSGTEN